MRNRLILSKCVCVLLAIPILGQSGPCGVSVTPPSDISDNTPPRGTTPTTPPPIPPQPPPPPPPPVVGTIATFRVTVWPFTVQGSSANALWVYDDDGQELNGLRKGFAGIQSKTFTFSLSPGTYRFYGFSTVTLRSHYLSTYGYVDLTAGMNETAEGDAYLFLFCDPGRQPGQTCNDGPDSDDDGVPDDHDGCPYDSDKVEAGDCGCGNAEIAGCGDMTVITESEPNDLWMEADSLPLAAGTVTVRGDLTYRGLFGTPDTDVFRFQAVAGDQIVVTVDWDCQTCSVTITCDYGSYLDSCPGVHYNVQNPEIIIDATYTGEYAVELGSCQGPFCSESNTTPYVLTVSIQ